MTLSDANKEFAVRYYLWALSEFKREIEEGFPSFGSFRSGAVLGTLQFMQLLDKDEQITLAHALLHRFHPEAVKYLGENCSPEEESLRSRRDGFFQVRSFYNSVRHCQSNGMVEEAEHLFKDMRDDLVLVLGDTGWSDDETLRAEANRVFDMFPVSLEEKIEARKQAGERLRFASKRKLRGVIKSKFEAAFENQWSAPESVDDVEGLAFRMNCNDWIIRTDFWFGRSASLLDYHHSIVSQTTFERAGNEFPKMNLAQQISFAAWMGLTSQTQWECLTDEEVEPACDATIKHCAHFFAVAPKLLKGLNANELTAE